jgi:SWI/SNF-related matrix-associated actin-dependent regulator of chromatin subfamily D
VSGQSWQQNNDAQSSNGTVNVETGEGIPAWQLKIEGRLLEVHSVQLCLNRCALNFVQLPNQRSKDRAPPRKFSTFVKQIIVEMERDPAQYPDSNTVEVRFNMFHISLEFTTVMQWIRNPTQNHQPLDGFAVRRRGDIPTKIRVVMHLEQQPEVYKIHPDLGLYFVIGSSYPHCSPFVR